MSMPAEPHHLTALPTLAPDLVVVVSKGDSRLQRLSPALARLARIAPDAAAGEPVDDIFPDAVPPLSSLIDEVAADGQALSGIWVRLTSAGPLLQAEVRPAGIVDSGGGQVVTLAFRAPSARAVGGAPPFAAMVGSSPAIREVFRKIALYAPAEAAVVITGETGTGKELVAQALHDGGSRAQGPFVAVNCAAMSEELLESELFGHEKGAFTGAVRSHRGRFERADGGTLFLDEIGDMPLHTQTRLLRVLEAGRIERVGAEQEQAVDVRVVAATNVPLEEAVGRRQFRADLYHRLAVLRIHLPPLRERLEDVPALVEHFLAAFSDKYRRQIQRLTPEALTLLQSYLWPGNVRELRNVLERVFVETQGEVIGARALREWVGERQGFASGRRGAEVPASPVLAPPYPLASAQSLLEAPPAAQPLPRRTTRPVDLDAEAIRRAFHATGGNLAAAARLLGVHRATLYRYLDKLNLSRRQLQR